MTGTLRGQPVGFLTAFMVITLLTILVRWVGASRQTRAGQEALQDAEEQAARLKLGPAHGEAGMAVALFGTSVLAVGALGDFHRMRSTGGDSGGGGGDSGSSDGGCGAGGCGGCGG